MMKEERHLRQVLYTRWPTNWWGSAKRDVTHPTVAASIIPAIACSENVHAWPGIDQHGPVDRVDNMTPANHVMHRSITRKSQSPFYVTHRLRWVHLSTNFWDRGAKMSNSLHKRKLSPWIKVSKTVNFTKPSSRNRDLDMTKNENVYAIFCWPALADYVISGENGDYRWLCCV